MWLNLCLPSTTGYLAKRRLPMLSRTSSISMVVYDGPEAWAQMRTGRGMGKVAGYCLRGQSYFRGCYTILTHIQ